jgi:hypothetical protein
MTTDKPALTLVPTKHTEHFSTVGNDGWTFDLEPITARHLAIDLEAWLNNQAPAPKWGEGILLSDAPGTGLLIDVVDPTGPNGVRTFTITVEEH